MFDIIARKIKTFTLQCFLVLALAFTINILDSTLCQAGTVDRGESLLEWETTNQYIKNVGIFEWAVKNLVSCFRKSYIFSMEELSNICLPTEIGDEEGLIDECANIETGWLAGTRTVWTWTMLAVALIAIAAAFFIGIATSWLGIGFVILALVGVVALANAYFCANLFVVQPHEFLNMKHNMLKCELQADGNVRNIAGPREENGEMEYPLTQQDLPYFGHCNRGKAEDKYRPYGYLGDIPCANKQIKRWVDEEYTVWNQEDINGYEIQKLVIGSIVVAWVAKNDNGCVEISKNPEHSDKMLESNGNSNGNREGYLEKNRLILFGLLTPERIRRDKEMELDSNSDFVPDPNISGFYAFNHGKIQLCAYTSSTLSPIRIGCTSIAPPVEKLKASNQQIPWLNDTRCLYLNQSRQDLQAVGHQIHKIEKNHPVGLFLMSDMHYISTVMGCIEDLLYKVMMGVKPDGSDSFIAKIQKVMKTLILVMLTFYVMFTALKLITSGQPLAYGEWVMMIIKFALVLYFSTSTSVWIKDKNTGEGLNIYGSIQKIIPNLVEVFMKPAMQSDPYQMCYYDLKNGKNILSNNELASGNYTGHTVSGFQYSTPIPGEQQSNIIKITIWDFLDCKWINYLNLGNCQYTFDGLLSVIMIPLSILTFKMHTILMALSSFIYVIMIAKIFFNFVYMILISTMIITILVLVAPLMLCFALFDYLKEVFNSWLRSLISYTLSCAVMIILCLVLVSLDSVLTKALEEGGIKFADGVATISGKSLASVKDENGKPAVASDKKVKACETLSSTNMLFSFFGSGTGAFGMLSAQLTDDAQQKMKEPMLFLAIISVLFYFFINAAVEFLSAMTMAYDAKTDRFSMGAGQTTGIVTGLAQASGKAAFHGIVKGAISAVKTGGKAAGRGAAGDGGANAAAGGQGGAAGNNNNP